MQVFDYHFQAESGRSILRHTYSYCLIPIILNNSKKHFAARQQCERNPLLSFHSNTEHFYIVDRCIYAKNNKKKRYCYVSMAKMVNWARNILTLYVQYIVFYMSDNQGRKFPKQFF
jgi:hypothetical protein